MKLAFQVINLLYIIYGNALFSALITWNIQVDTLSTTFTEVHKRRQIWVRVQTQIMCWKTRWIYKYCDV